MPTRTRIALAAIAALTMVAITIVGAVGVARAPDRSDPATALVVMLVGGAIASGLLGVVLLVPAERQRRATVDMLGRERARRRGAELRYETLVHELPAGVVRTDEHGEFRYVNERWTELTGLTLDNARDWRSVVHPDDRHLFATLQRGNGEQSPVTSRHRLCRADGAERWVQSRVVPMYDPVSNAFAGWLGVLVMVTGIVWFVAGAGLEPGWRKGAIAIGEMVEALFQLAVNTLSFARVGAFALAHAGLSIAVVSLADAAGTIGYWPILVIGNAFVIALEGLVVSIQTTRLLLFEFFIRFLHAGGREFRPLQPPQINQAGLAEGEQ